ncbi:lethal(2) giant larvae protein 1-like isoform X2 [Leptotrombidium deliense]|uniref:Lethal(2) giant larvae protein 1-like isoform X2 n=1 Tax=Leptotrombidium deliense TaxID=299467 RepID=A0A443SFI2_9ACAR|nr:lethal(2) giant larvae protein 1-like isoform X2 [Leptotrombidium deliense]
MQEINCIPSIFQTVAHGFPHRPNCLAFDPTLGLLAIGTRNGEIRVYVNHHKFVLELCLKVLFSFLLILLSNNLYGKPGVELEAKIDAEIEVRQILFVENRGQLVTLCEDSSIYLWQISSKKDESGKNVTVLEKTKTCETFNKEHREGNLKKPTTLTVDLKSNRLLVGTQGGNIFALDLKTLDLMDVIIYQDVVLQNIPDEHKRTNPGEVETILLQPGNDDKILIGYNKGLMVLWDNEKLVADHYYVANQQLESVCWLRNGEQFMSSHNDGGYIVWNVNDNINPSESSKIPYGPFPCKPLTKIVWKTVRNSDDFIIFSGGMPRASFSDKNTVSVIQGTIDTGKQRVLDFSSKVIDFIVIDGDADDEYDNPKALIVLSEEELVAIDLRSEEWLQYRLPYLWSVHSSAITCVQHYSDISQELLDKIVDAGKRQSEGKYSFGEWPITGGEIDENAYKEGKDILITGHEDGSVRFWSAGGVCMQHIYTLQTKKLFTSPDDDIAPIDGDEVPLGGSADSEWPAFQKVGTYDPYSDDCRLAVRKVTLCPLNNILAVAGTAGQVVVFDFKEDDAEESLTVTPVDIVPDGEGFVWKGHAKLNHTVGKVKLEAGFQPRSILQISPPAAVTALTVHSNWSLVAAGTSHGFTVFDYLQNKSVMSKSTLKTVDLNTTAGSDALISRRKSFKKSLRESFRRLRKGRSQRGKKSPAEKAASPASTSSLPPGETSVKSILSNDSVKTVERSVEARSDDGMGSMVRCLYFANACITNVSSALTPTLWAGTNAGTVYVFTITIPAEEKRDSESVTCQLAKEIQLKHKAPVIFIHIVDTLGNPLPEVGEEKGEKNKYSTSVPSRVLICSEEQFKLFTLPALKPFCKSKLTAHEGSHARRIAIARFVSKSDERHVENCLMCLSNQGDITIYTLNDLKRQLQSTLTKREDINGISNSAFTKDAEGVFLHSPCEFRRFSFSAKRCLKLNWLLTGVAIETVEPAVEAIETISENPEKEAEPDENVDATKSTIDEADLSLDIIKEVCENQIEPENETKTQTVETKTVKKVEVIVSHNGDVKSEEDVKESVTKSVTVNNECITEVTKITNGEIESVERKIEHLKSDADSDGLNESTKSDKGEIERVLEYCKNEIEANDAKKSAMIMSQNGDANEP